MNGRPLEWTTHGARAVLYDGRLSVYAEPSMRADDGTVAVGIDCEALSEVLAAVEALRWNVSNGHDEDSDVIVERASWSRLRRALGRLR